MFNHKTKKGFVSVLFLAFFSIFIMAGIVTAQNYTLEKSVVDQGGGAAHSTNYQIVNAAGQPCPVGVIQSTNYTVFAGFLAGDKLITSIDEPEIESELIPDAFKLRQNYPNPFNPETTIQFYVKEPCLVELAVFDLLGREVAELLNDHYQPGQYQIMFDASKLPSGIYFYQIRMKSFEAIKKMMLLE